MRHELYDDAKLLGRFMAECGHPRQTDFVDEELKQAFFESFDERKAELAGTPKGCSACGDSVVKGSDLCSRCLHEWTMVNDKEAA